MEKNTKIDEIKMSEDILGLLSIMAELFEPMNWFQFGLPKGLCILTEEPGQKDALLDALSQLEDTVILSSPKTSKLHLPNYKLAVYAPQKYDKPEILNDFLKHPEFLTAAIAGGTVPDNLPDAYRILLPAVSPSLCSDRDLDCEIADVKDYLRENPGEMEKVLDSFDTSADYLQHSDQSPLYVQLLIAAKMYCLWYRSYYTEPETWNRYNCLTRTIQTVYDITKSSMENYDLQDIIIKLYLNYIETHTDILFLPADSADTESCINRDNQSIIFYDSLYYYVSEMLMKDICRPLLNSMRWPGIKESMRLSGILCCNLCQDKSYTRKKIIVTNNGTDIRQRFLWLSKKYFLSPDRLAPEERNQL